MSTVWLEWITATVQEALLVQVPRLGKYLMLAEFCTCTQTYQRFADQIKPFPKNLNETLPALEALCQRIIDPVIAALAEQLALDRPWPRDWGTGVQPEGDRRPLPGVENPVPGSLREKGRGDSAAAAAAAGL